MAEQEVVPFETQQVQSVRAEVEGARAIQEVQAAFVIAKKFPRDETAAELKILKACERYSLAEQAVYAYPRGGEKVTGASIRLAEAIAQYWGNMKYGFRVLESREGSSEVEAFCFDLENNTHISRSFTIDHKMKLKSGQMKFLNDPRDIYELVANYSQRRVRACILEVIPGDVVEKAVNACQRTMVKGEKNIPHSEAVKLMLQAFDKLGVSKEMIEKKVAHGTDTINPEELADLKQIFNSLKDQQTKREDWFDFKREEAGKATDLQERLKAKKTAETPAPAPGDFANYEGGIVK